MLSDAVARRALLAVVGPRADPPSGATRVFQVEEEGRPPIAFAPNQLYQLNTAIEAHIAGVDPEEEFRGLVVQAFLPPPETAVGWLLAKGDAGRYGVTEAGRRAWQVVRALAERKPPSLLILKS